MRRFGIAVLSLVGVAVSASLAAASIAGYEKYQVGPLGIEQVWSRAAQGGEADAAGYMNIENTGSEPDRLVGGSSGVADRFEIYGMSVDDGVMRMRPLSSGLEIKPGETVEFKPNSFHVLMTGLKRPIQADEHFTATLVFEKAGEVEVDFLVE